MTSNPLENPLYYLHNFRQVLNWLQLRYADVLSADEQRFILDFAQLAEPSQALLVRMVMRKGRHFRLSKLSYPEIGDSAAALEPLLALGWLDADAPMTLDELFGLHTRPELDRMFAGLSLIHI